MPSPADSERAGAVLARAFVDDPLYAYMHPEPAARQAWLAGYMPRVLRLLAPGGLGVHTLGPDEDPGHALAVLVMLPPFAYPPPLSRKLGFASRVLGVAPRPPFGRLRRSLALLGAVDKAHPSEPHHYIPLLGVDPDGQGRGLGSRLMTLACELGDADGHPIYLETANRANLGYYERFGFGLAQEIRPIQDAPAVFQMKR